MTYEHDEDEHRNLEPDDYQHIDSDGAWSSASDEERVAFLNSFPFVKLCRIVKPLEDTLDEIETHIHRGIN